MSEFYTAVIVMVWLTLGVLCVLVQENSRVSAGSKRQFYLTYALIAAAALAEWLGVSLNGKADSPIWILKAVKCADYILTPLAGVAFAMQLGLRNIWQRMLLAAVSVNTVFQIVAGFCGWMVTFDALHHYSHGPIYPVYIVLYVLVMALASIQFILYGRSFRRQNRTSLFSVIALVLIGIAMQEVFSGVRTAYLALTFGAALLFIHFAEFTQLATDDILSRQMIEITTDPLTGMKSRNAYSRVLNDYEAHGGVPDDFAVILIDINGLKAVNDSIGHEAGDELIRGAADCICSELGMGYRIGGDEFVVMCSMDRTRAEEALARLHDASVSWKGKLVGKLSLSAGYALAAEYPGLSAEALVREADREMYKAKAQYYRENGIDRRKR